MGDAVKPGDSIAGTYRCLIVEDETLVALGLQSQLEQLGHAVVGHAAEGRAAEAIFRTEHPELVLTDIRLGGEDGLELAARLLKIRACPIIIISAYSEPELIERATAIGVFGYLVKPVLINTLAAQIQVAASRFRAHMVLLAEKEALALNLENRKLVERAKGILMKRFNLQEPEAHKRLQQESQRRRLGLVELARKVIESDELLGMGS